ncbi:MAG: hypothetical protein ABJA34_03460 [Pseudonocardiales bacterium]
MLDIDGVVADVRHRLVHLESRPKDWKAFFAAAPADSPLAEGLALAQALAAEHDIIWLTGRPERLRRVTVAWLRSHGLPTAELHMRRNGDHRPARETKVAVVRRIAAERSIAVVVDDDPAVVDALLAAGLPVHRADWVPYAESLRQGQQAEGRT